MKKYLFVFFLMSVSMIMSAQVQVKGVVTASDNGQTLVGVSVFEKATRAWCLVWTRWNNKELIG